MAGSGHQSFGHLNGGTRRVRIDKSPGLHNDNIGRKLTFHDESD